MLRCQLFITKATVIISTIGYLSSSRNKPDPAFYCKLVLLIKTAIKVQVPKEGI